MGFTSLWASCGEAVFFAKDPIDHPHIKGVTVLSSGRVTSNHHEPSPILWSSSAQGRAQHCGYIVLWYAIWLVIFWFWSSEVSKSFRWIFQTWHLCVHRDMSVMYAFKPTRFFPMINAWSIHPFHPLSRSKVPSPSTRLAPPKKETETEHSFFHTSSQASFHLFLVFFFGGGPKKSSGNLGIIQALSIHCSLARFLPQLFAAAMAVEKTDAAVDVADAMVKAVRQAVETTLQKLGWWKSGSW